MLPRTARTRQKGHALHPFLAPPGFAPPPKAQRNDQYKDDRDKGRYAEPEEGIAIAP